MKKLILITPDFNITAAELLIAIRSKKSNTTIILAELIRLADNGTIHSAPSLHNHFSSKFNISYKNYVRIIDKLSKLKILHRSTTSLILCPELTSIQQLTIKR